METVAQKPPIHTRPFNAEHAKAGAPYCCRDGSEATVLRWDGRKDGEPIVGVRTERDIPTSWSENGIYFSPHGESADDLVMKPLGFIDGKPVFVGDKLVDPSGAVFVPGPSNGGHLAGCIWPAPEKVYPTLTQADINTIKGWSGQNWQTNFANAILRHAIDAGQVITKEDHEAALHRLGDSLRPVADSMSVDVSRRERDIAIARSVLRACKERFDASPSVNYLGSHVVTRLSGVHLHGVIAEIAP